MENTCRENEGGGRAHRPVIKTSPRHLAGDPPLDRAWQVCLSEPQDRFKADEQQRYFSALPRMGYAKDEMSGHGFRSMASTLLNEQGWNRDAIERQLAHAERNSVRAAYNYAEFMPERKKMMQAWADYLEGIKSGAIIIPLRATG